MSVLKTACKTVATLVPASQLARLGLPALLSVEALAVVLLIGVGWVVLDKDRSANLALILGRRRREAPPPRPVPPLRPAPREERMSHPRGYDHGNGISFRDSA